MNYCNKCGARTTHTYSGREGDPIRDHCPQCSRIEELQRKYDALIQKLHDKMNEIDNRRGAGSQLLELDELRALLRETNDE